MGADIADLERVAVGGRLGDARAARHAGGGPDILDDDGLAEQFAHALRLDAGAHVDAAAGRERNHQGHGAGRKILRAPRA